MPTLVYGNRVPLYRQVAQALRQRVRTGVYAAGQPLPTMRALALEYGVSVYAIQKAIYELEKEQVVVTHHGKGIMVMEEKPCDQAAILFGMIEPYEDYMGFESLILHVAEKVFNNRNDFMVTRSSEGKPAKEQAIAQHFARNGVKGIIVWPVENDPNGPFLTELAKSIPIVIIDRKIKNCPLPTITNDMRQAGHDVCNQILKKRNRKKMLVLVDDRNLSPYDDFASGLRDASARLGRERDLLIYKIPASELCRQFTLGDYSQISKYRKKINDLLIKGRFDALFCSQDEVLDRVVIDTGLIDGFPNLQLATIIHLSLRKTAGRLRTFGDCDVLEWLPNLSLVMQTAANMVQKWVYTRKKPQQGLTIPLELINDDSGKIDKYKKQGKEVGIR